MLKHSQGTFCRVVRLGINTTAPAVGLSRVPQNTIKTTLTYHMVPRACLLASTNQKKKKKFATIRKLYSYVPVPYSSKNIS